MNDVLMNLEWAMEQYGRFVSQFLGPCFRKNSIEQRQDSDRADIHHAFRNFLLFGGNDFRKFHGVRPFPLSQQKTVPKLDQLAQKVNRYTGQSGCVHPQHPADVFFFVCLIADCNSSKLIIVSAEKTFHSLGIRFRHVSASGLSHLVGSNIFPNLG